MAEKPSKMAHTRSSPFEGDFETADQCFHHNSIYGFWRLKFGTGNSVGENMVGRGARGSWFNALRQSEDCRYEGYKWEHLHQ